MEEKKKKKRRSVDLRQCFLYIWDHIVIILLVGVLLAGVLGGFRYFKVNKTVSQQQTFDSIVSQNRSNYYPTNSSDQTPNTESKKVDGSCIIRAAIYVDFDFSKIEGNSNSDFSSMVYRYQQDSIFRLISDHTLYSIANEINSRSYDIADETKDLTGEDIRWLINVRITGANIIQFSVTDINTQRAMDIAEMLADSFIEQTSSNPTIDKARILEEPAVFSDTTDVKTSIDLRSVISHAIVGGFAGVALTIGIYLLIFLFTDRVRTSDDTDYVGLVSYGRIPNKADRRDREYKRLAYNLTTEKDKKKVLFVPVDPKTDIGDMTEKVAQELKAVDSDIVPVRADDIKSSPDAILEAKKSDAVMLVASYGTTTIKDLEYAKAEMSKTGKDIIGVVIDRCKHR